MNNFDKFLTIFAEAFGENDKIYWATIKIRSFQQGSYSTFVYQSNLKQLACDTNSNEAPMNKFHLGYKMM